MDIKTQLGEIGIQLDELMFPTVMDSGLVLPSKLTVPYLNLGKEQPDETRESREGQSETSAQQWPGQWSRTQSTRASSESGRPWATSGASSFSLSKEDDSLYPGLSEVNQAYPGAMIFRQGGGFWLRLESQLLPALGRRALFIVSVVPKTKQVTAWGYWYFPSVGVSWIGPRHTNYPDGSICAFDMEDGSWRYGESIVKVLDFYTVWALRHLHLEWIGRWPGPQASSSAVERYFEFKDEELCGCGKSQEKYQNCCKQKDRKYINPKSVLLFWLFSQRIKRQPLTAISDFAFSGVNPPELNS